MHAVFPVESLGKTLEWNMATYLLYILPFPRYEGVTKDQLPKK